MYIYIYIHIYMLLPPLPHKWSMEVVAEPIDRNNINNNYYLLWSRFVFFSVRGRKRNAVPTLSGERILQLSKAHGLTQTRNRFLCRA